MTPSPLPWDSVDFFKQVIQSARNTAIIVTDPQGIIRLFNSGAQELLGYSSEEVVGLKTPILIHLEEEVNRRGEELTQALGYPVRGFEVFVELCRREKFEEKQWTYLHKSGRKIPVSLSVTPLLSPEGKIEAFMGVAVDISEAKKKEELIQAQVQELRAKNEELSGFTYTVSHDLKSPLLTIKGFLGAVLQDLEKGRLDRLEPDLQRILKAANHMQGLLEDLLELSRIGRITNVPSHIPMGDTVRKVLENLTGGLTGSQTKVFWDGEMEDAWGDEVRISEVWQNLIENAIKYRQPGTPCEITLGYSKESQAYFVKDKGVGIPRESQERIFGLFTKLNTHSEGTGIGLALVKKIVEYHGGRVWVESPGLNQGSTFYFSLGKKN